MVENPVDQYVDVQAVAEIMNASRSSIWAWSKANLIPRPIKLGRRTTRWSLNAIRAFMAKQEGKESAS